VSAPITREESVAKARLNVLLHAVIAGHEIERRVPVPTWCPATPRALFAHLGESAENDVSDFRVAAKKPEMQEVNGISFPKPLQELPPAGTRIFQVEASAVARWLSIKTWLTSTPSDLHVIHSNTCHLTAEAALQHLSALMVGWVKNLKD
jgi:hypothetical protein